MTSILINFLFPRMFNYLSHDFPFLMTPLILPIFPVFSLSLLPQLIPMLMIFSTQPNTESPTETPFLPFKNFPPCLGFCAWPHRPYLSLFPAPLILFRMGLPLSIYHHMILLLLQMILFPLQMIKLFFLLIFPKVNDLDVLILLFVILFAIM